MDRLKNDSIPRRELARIIRERIDTLGLNREEAAKIVGDASTQVSRLYTDHPEEFSADRLVRWLLRLGCPVRIEVGFPTGTKPRKAVIFDRAV